MLEVPHRANVAGQMLIMEHRDLSCQENYHGPLSARTKLGWGDLLATAIMVE